MLLLLHLILLFLILDLILLANYKLLFLKYFITYKEKLNLKK